MYINRLYYKNVGPISELDIQFRTNNNGVPVPLVIVGKNGSGKSILLSNIVDALYELADKAYDNATQFEGNGHQYYKEISPSHIKVGEAYMISHICFQQKDRNIEYIFKSGKLSFGEYMTSRGGNFCPELDWGEENNYKFITSTEKDVIDIFEDSVVCYFGPNRYMKPSWMGIKYFETKDIATYSLRPRYAKQLNNPITAENISELTLQWLFDVITDSRADLEKNYREGSYNISFPSVNDLDLLSISRLNSEKIMSEILCEDVIFRMGNRSKGKQRFSIQKKSNGTIIAPSLDALSTGQLSLFNLFATIVRYADTDDINLSHKLNDITGVIVIDEIELHLHSQLQKEILPKLIALFPKVQFIITSHSPLFLLGMKDQFGDDGFDVVEMPSGNKISVEQFSEFENAYLYLSDTERYRKDIQTAIDSKKEKPLIITEGSTDWKHMKAAYNNLINDPRCSNWLPNLDFEFLEYEPKNSFKENCYKLEMGSSNLELICRNYSLMHQPRKIIFISDADVKKVSEKLAGENSSYKTWGNNVYSLILPVPEHRKDTPEICIEHYYVDKDLKTEVEINGVKRRLYMGNEFDSFGFSLDKQLFCTNKNSCGDNKISIIDGHAQKSIVFQISDEKRENLAISKMCFAEMILQGTDSIAQIDFSSFIPLFEIIREILMD